MKRQYLIVTLFFILLIGYYFILSYFNHMIPSTCKEDDYNKDIVINDLRDHRDEFKMMVSILSKDAFNHIHYTQDKIYVDEQLLDDVDSFNLEEKHLLQLFFEKRPVKEMNILIYDQDYFVFIYNKQFKVSLYREETSVEVLPCLYHTQKNLNREEVYLGFVLNRD